VRYLYVRGLRGDSWTEPGGQRVQVVSAYSHHLLWNLYNDCSEETSMNRHTDTECFDNLHISYT
jgi:hypothetical protein